MMTLGRKTTLAATVMAGLLAAGAARADGYGYGNGNSGSVYIEITGFPGYSQDNKQTNVLGGSTSNMNPPVEAGFSYDLRNMVGYKVWGGLVLGLNYNYASSPTSAPATSTLASVDRTQTWSQWGASIGYVGDNFRLIGTYIFSATEKLAEHDLNADGSVSADYVTRNEGGSGYQFTLGYAFPVTGSFKIGPTIIYRHVSYKTQSLTDNVTPGNNYSGAAFTTDAVESNLTPMISLIFGF